MINFLSFGRRPKGSFGLFLSNGLWLSFRYAIISLLGFFVSIIFAREYPPALYGEFQLILSSMALFSVFSLPGLNMLGMRSIASSGVDCVPQIVKVSFLTSLIAIPFLAIYGLYFLEVKENIYWIVGLMTLCFPLFYAPNSWYVYYEGRSLFRSSAFRLILLSLVTSALLIVGIFLRLSVLELFAVYLFSNIFLSWAYYFEIRNNSPQKSIVSLKASLDWRYAISVSVQKYIIGLSEYLPIIAISFLMGVSMVAQFQIAFIFFSAVSGFVGALATLYLPHLFKNNNSGHLTIFFQSIIVGIVAMVGYWFLVKYLFFRVYGNQYSDGFWIAQTFFMLPFLASLRTFLVNFFTTRGRNVFLIVVYVVANIFSLLLFVFSKNFESPLVSISLYIYTLFVCILIPLIVSYFLIAFKKTDSI